MEDELEGDFKCFAHPLTVTLLIQFPSSRYFRASFERDANQGSWAFSFQEDEFQEDLRGASGVGKRRRARMRVSSLPPTIDNRRRFTLDIPSSVRLYRPVRASQMTRARSLVKPSSPSQGATTRLLSPTSKRSSEESQSISRCALLHFLYHSNTSG